MFIKKIIIENFQSHNYSELELSSNTNMIIGPSDHGKSAIIRAIKWVFFNDPKGNDFIQNGETFAKVHLIMSNGQTIIREKSSSKNRYIVIDKDQNTNIYEGFGSTIPEEVQKAHGVSKIMIDTDSDVAINLGEQMSPPFLLSETGATKAKAIGRLTGAHVIDKAIRDTSNDIKKENQNQNRLKKDIDEINIKLKEFENLEDLKTKIDLKEKLIAKLENKAHRLILLQKYQDNLNLINQEISASHKSINKLKDLTIFELNISKTSEYITKYTILKLLFSKLQKNINEEIFEKNILYKTKNLDILNTNYNILKDKTLFYNKILILNQKFKIIQKEINEINTYFIKFKSVDDVSIKIVQVLQKLVLFEKLNSLNLNLKSNFKSIQSGLDYIKQISSELNISLMNYENALKSFSKCPLCLHEINNATIKKILDQFREEN